jgi:hypothetical protein
LDLGGQPGERVRRRAYEIWEAEGRPEGKEFDHWARAELDVAAEEGAGTAPKGRGRKGKAAAQ